MTPEEIVRLLSETLDLDLVATRIVDGVRTLLQVEAAVIYQRDASTDDMVATAVSGDVGPSLGSTIVFPRGTGVVGVALRERRPVVSANLLTDARITLTPELRAHIEQAAYRAVLCVPLIAQEHVIGALSIGAQPGRVFTGEEMRVAQMFADHAAIAVRNASLFREAEERRREAEAAATQYRGLFESANDPIVTFDIEGLITSANPEAERILGHPRAELIGQHFREFVHPDSTERVIALGLRLLAGEAVSPNVEVAGMARDGHEVVAEGRLSLLRSQRGRPIGWQVIYRDITERKLAEAALRASDERHRQLVDGSIQGIHISRDWITLFVNQSLARMLGVKDPAELIGLDSRVFIAPEDLPRIESYAAARARGAPVPSRYELRGLRRDGAPIWVDMEVSLIHWDGAPAILSTMLDVTERKRAEEALALQEEQLRQAQKMDAVGQLAGGIAHDFNNLLAVIQGRSELLLRRHGSDERLGRDLRLINDTTARASALVQQLLAFSRRQVLQPALIDLNDVVGNIATMLRRIIGSEIDLRTELGAGLARVTADAVQMEQVIVNLAVNARDAMPGGGRLLLATTRGDIDAAAAARIPEARPGPHVVVTVKDTGAGMDALTLARIFEPFFTTKEPGRGTGLGLSTVYGIVKQSGGFVTVESERGRGTTFQIYLPCVDDVDTALEPATGASQEPSTARTILLVDDDDGVREIVRDILAEAGFVVLEAGNGEEAMRIVERDDGAIRVLLTDVVMPKMNGLQLAKHVGVRRPEVRILYMSGHVDPAGLEDRALLAGAVLLSKPFAEDALLRCVRTAFDE